MPLPFIDAMRGSDRTEQARWIDWRLIFVLAKSQEVQLLWDVALYLLAVPAMAEFAAQPAAARIARGLLDSCDRHRRGEAARPVIGAVRGPVGISGRIECEHRHGDLLQARASTRPVLHVHPAPTPKASFSNEGR